jgi:amidase
MIDAGVTLFGKTNVPLNLADWQSYNEVYGSTNNPWDLGRTPGGSSGGSGAALAAGLTGIEAGSDIGASIRNPAHYCGVWGHKPSWGVVSPKGHALAGAVAYGDIGVVGPLARGAEDLEIALDGDGRPRFAIDGRGWTLSLAPLHEDEAARLQGGGAADRSQRRGRRLGAGADFQARLVPRQEQGQGERARRARPSTRRS